MDFVQIYGAIEVIVISVIYSVICFDFSSASVTSQSTSSHRSLSPTADVLYFFIGIFKKAD